MEDFMAGLARVVIRFRYVVIAGWLLRCPVRALGGAVDAKTVWQGILEETLKRGSSGRKVVSGRKR